MSPWQFLTPIAWRIFCLMWSDNNGNDSLLLPNSQKLFRVYFCIHFPRCSFAMTRLSAVWMNVFLHYFNFFLKYGKSLMKSSCSSIHSAICHLASSWALSLIVNMSKTNKSINFRLIDAKLYSNCFLIRLDDATNIQCVKVSWHIRFASNNLENDLFDGVKQIFKFKWCSIY